MGKEAWAEQKNKQEEERKIKYKGIKLTLAFNLFAGCIYLIPTKFIYGEDLKWLQKGASVFFYFLITFPVFALWITSFPKRKREGRIKPMEFILMLPFLLIPFVPLLFTLLSKKILISYIPFVISWEFWTIGIGYIFQIHKKEDYCTISTTATVVDNIKSMMNSTVEKTNYISTYHPVLEYYVDNQYKRIICDDGQPRPLIIGTVITIYYNPHKPEEFRFEAEHKPFTEKYVGFIILGIGTFLFIITACIIIFF